MALAASTPPTIQVIATTFDGTRAALATAVLLARGAGARLSLIVPRIVPFPIELDNPVDSTSLLVKRYCGIIQDLGGDAGVAVCLCRRIDDLLDRLDGDWATTVVVGGPASGRWLMSPEERFAHRMSRRGPHVVYVVSASASPRRRAPVECDDPHG